MALPCSIEASSGGLVLHSLGAGSGSVVANVTRMSDFVVASLAGADPAAFHASFDADAAAGVTASAVAQAEARVATDLTAAGLSAVAVADPLGAALTPGASTGYGAAVAQLEGQVATGGATQAQLAAAFAAASPAAAAPTADEASLPAAQLLATPAANCASLRSGRYRVLSPQFGDGAAANQSYVVNIDAATLALGDETGVFTTFRANGSCRFVDDAAREFVVSPAGVLVGHAVNDDGRQRLFVAFAEQSHTVAELAGDYVSLGFDEVDESATGPVDAVYAPSSGSPSLAASGAITGLDCNGFDDCIVATHTRTVATRDDGGFLMTDVTAGWSQLLYAYRGGDGHLMVVSIADDGSLGFVTAAGAASVPVVDAVTASWSLWADTAAVYGGAISEDQSTVMSVDGGSHSWVRRSDVDGHVETLFLDQPRAGYTHRAEGTATTTAGTTVPVRDFTRLDLRGMGVQVGWQPALGTGSFILSVRKP
jgi:hypothetical protein